MSGRDDDGAVEGDGEPDHGGRSPGFSIRALNTNERLTAFFAFCSLLVAIGSLATAVVSCQNAKDTSDIKAAVKGLTRLAGEQKRQADAANLQVGALSRQADAAQGQLEAAKAQTVATLKSANAAVNSAAASARAAEASTRAAEAERRMAEVTEKTQRPRITLGELDVGGFKDPPDNTGLVPISVNWRFNNSGGGSLRAKQVEWGLFFGLVLPPVMPHGFVTPGNDYVIVNSLTSGLRLREPVPMHIDPANRDAVDNGAKRLFFFARFDYDDGVTGEPRSKCFGEEVLIESGAATGHRPAGGQAYQCDGPRISTTAPTSVP